MDFALARAKLIQHLRRDIKDERLLGAMQRVPRELFVPRAHQQAAYEDRPLPIESGQTISQPLIIAMMTEALELKGSEKVLEVGTGSGYQAAILAELARRVVTVERHALLAERARQLLDRLGYTNVEVHLAERTLGWKQEAPYDAIIVSAGAPKIPPELVEQLAPDGRLVIPVGSRWEQSLIKVIREADGIITCDMGPCRWVPLVGEGAWENNSKSL